jgi:hypothetical protein
VRHFQAPGEEQEKQPPLDILEQGQAPEIRGHIPDGPGDRQEPFDAFMTRHHPDAAGADQRLHRQHPCEREANDPHGAPDLALGVRLQEMKGHVGQDADHEGAHQRP